MPMETPQWRRSELPSKSTKIVYKTYIFYTLISRLHLYLSVCLSQVRFLKRGDRSVPGREYHGLRRCGSKCEHIFFCCCSHFLVHYCSVTPHWVCTVVVYRTLRSELNRCFFILHKAGALTTYSIDGPCMAGYALLLHPVRNIFWKP
jgi:hypothetical protein